jgi:hypothetical protein
MYLIIVFLDDSLFINDQIKLIAVSMILE